MKTKYHHISDLVPSGEKPADHYQVVAEEFFRIANKEGYVLDMAQFQCWDEPVLLVTGWEEISTVHCSAPIKELA